jgi:hypothetical protein
MSAPAPRRSVLPSLLVGLLLLASTLALVPTVPVLLLLVAEGAASLGSHPDNLAFVAFAGTTLVAWPLATLAGWVLLALGRRWTALAGLLGSGLLAGCAGLAGVVVAAVGG